MACAEKLTSCIAHFIGFIMDLPPAARCPACTWMYLVDRSVVARACVYIVHLSLYCTTLENIEILKCNILVADQDEVLEQDAKSLKRKFEDDEGCEYNALKHSKLA